jgi:hypothetical protein
MMAWFGWARLKAHMPSGASADGTDLFDPIMILHALDRAVPRYLGRVDRGELIFPAFKRTIADRDGDVRAVWEHTRLEAMRYVVMVPKRDFGLLFEPARQSQILETFLRKRAHTKTSIDFTGVPSDDIVNAIIAGFNWLDMCLAAVGVHQPSRSLTDFKNVAWLAEQWWAVEGAVPRCYHMLAERKRPPLMLYLIWLDYTGLAKEIASAAIYGSSSDQSAQIARTERTLEFSAADGALDTMSRLQRAEDPSELF